MWVTKVTFCLMLVASVNVNGFDINENYLFPSLTNVVEHSENEVCKAQTELYKQHLENLTLWAHEMWDASAKNPVGVLRGNVYQLGDWDECVTVNGPFKTQYCLATLSADVPSPDPPRDPLSLYYEPFGSVLDRVHKIDEISLLSRHEVQMGLCIPASCSITDLEKSLNEYLSITEFPLTKANVTYSAKVDEKMCQMSDENDYYDPVDKAFCFLSLIIFLLVILSTFYDFYKPGDEITSDKKPKNSTFSSNICLAFSARKNFLDLSRADESNPALSILYGIKIMSIFMIIMGHRFATFISGPIINFDYIEDEYRSVYAALFFHGDLFVDTFFVMSGLLVTYGILVQFDKKVINPLFIIFLRYIRLTPVYAFVIFFWSSMLYHIGEGSLWKLIVETEKMDCRNNWWINLLYLSNYVNDDHMCMTHSWYLPCDFHFFIMGTIIAFILHKNKRLGLSLMTFLFFVSTIIPLVITVVYLRPPLVQFYASTLIAPKIHTDFRLTYTKSHTRAVSYIIGMFAGYIYYRLKGSHKRLSRLASHALTFVSFMLILVCVISGTIFYDRYHEYNVIESGAYAGLHRAAWSVGTVGLLLSASYGHATIIKSVLSWSPWVPISKLVYGAYLIHVSFQFRSVAMSSAPKYYSYFDVISATCGDLIFAFLTALLMYLGIEAPVRKIFKEIFTPLRTPVNKLAPETTVVEENGGCNTMNNRDHDSRL